MRAMYDFLFRLPSADSNAFEVHQRCFDAVAGRFGYVPLVGSAVRMDPVLFRDTVANARKKYKKMEQQKL